MTNQISSRVWLIKGSEEVVKFAAGCPHGNVLTDVRAMLKVADLARIDRQCGHGIQFS